MELYFLFELLAFITAILFTWKGNWTIKQFVPFLFIIVVYEFGTLRGWFSINRSNLWAVNIIMLFGFIFYSFFIRQLVDNRKMKSFIFYSVIVVFSFFVINNIFIQGFWKLNTYSILFSSILLILHICYYFYELLTDESHNIRLIKYPYFWMSTGILFYYLGMFTFFASFEVMAYNNDYSYYSFFKLMSNVFNIFLYSCLSIGFIFTRKWERKLL